MRLSDISLSTRITLWALLFVVAGGLLWIEKDLENDREKDLRERSAGLEINLHLEQERLIRLHRVAASGCGVSRQHAAHLRYGACQYE